MEAKKYIVMVDDNFHPMDESERYKYGEFETAEEAIQACEAIVERSIEYEKGATPNKLFFKWKGFCENPFIIGEAKFSASNHARRYCKRICQEDSN